MLIGRLLLFRFIFVFDSSPILIRMNRYGLIGFPLEHSFSKKYFARKFKKMGLSSTHVYELFEFEFLRDFPSIWEKYRDLKGVNVTIPHKIDVMNFLDQLDDSAHKVGAVNVIKKKGDQLIGYNSDYYGFKRSLKNWIKDQKPEALILGSGGSSHSVQVALEELGIEYEVVSRTPDKGDFTYSEFDKNVALFQHYQLIINTTPIGMFPKVENGPPIPFGSLHEGQYVFDLIYNPEKTLLLKEAEKRGAKIKNGAEMLELQAERAWEIWTTQD